MAKLVHHAAITGRFITQGRPLQDEAPGTGPDLVVGSLLLTAPLTPKEAAEEAASAAVLGWSALFWRIVAVAASRHRAPAVPADAAIVLTINALIAAVVLRRPRPRA